MIDKDASARAVAGPDSARIKGDIRNFVQLIVVDDDGNIAAFDECRRTGDDDTEAELFINSITFGRTYHFLLLMGHWERDYEKEKTEGEGEYQYTPGPPTLLAAGLKDQLITGSGKVTVTMWPLVIDTAFSSGGLPAGPVVTSGKPGKAVLHPADWDVTWTVTRGAGGNGFADLIRAQKLTPGNAASETLLVKSGKTLVREGSGPDAEETWDNPAVLSGVLGNVVTRSLGAYTAGFDKIGREGSVNFNLEYAPFNLTGAEAWSMVEDTVFDLQEGGPVWIIRNGVNDDAQDGNTDFGVFHKIGDAGMGAANGNGAVRYGIAPKTPGEGSALEVRDGVFLGPSASITPEISFTTAGYTGEGEVYYAVVAAGEEAPDYSDYGLLVRAPQGPRSETVRVAEAGGDYDIYVIVYKDGEVSGPEIINTKEGDEDVDWIWGEASYKRYYVASYGDDGNPGTRAATVQRALAKLAAAYASDPGWPEKGGNRKAPEGSSYWGRWRSRRLRRLA
jgi:hypothetical protein